MVVYDVMTHMDVNIDSMVDIVDMVYFVDSKSNHDHPKLGNLFRDVSRIKTDCKSDRNLKERLVRIRIRIMLMMSVVMILLIKKFQNNKN